MSALDDCVMQKDHEDIVLKLKLSQYVAQWLGIENELVVIQGQITYRSRVNYGEMEGTY